MRLKVTGVETLEVVVPRGFSSKRKVIDPAALDRLRGQTLTSDELRIAFGYAKTTALQDTQLADHIERVDAGKRDPGSHSHRARWRVI